MVKEKRKTPYPSIRLSLHTAAESQNHPSERDQSVLENQSINARRQIVTLTPHYRPLCTRAH
jgi:hypothetical protein